MPQVICKCGCGRSKDVRQADINRGWGKFYSKSCKAKAQSKKCGGRPKASKEKRFRHLRDAYECGDISNEYFLIVLESEYPEFMTTEDEHEIALNDVHPFSDEGLGQWQD